MTGQGGDEARMPVTGSQDDSRDDRNALNARAEAHVRSHYEPKPRTERDGIALCMSGGGYRATLFDLGAMRRLDELGILSRVRTFASVSGGSIAAAFLAAHLVEGLGGIWPAAGDRIADFETGIAVPLRKMAGTNVRTRAALARLNPLNIRRQNASVDTLEQTYEKTITRSRIDQLPTEPGFVFCATDLTFRCEWWVDSRLRRAGNTRSGWITTDGDYWTIARAVAASSCFPGVFPPMEVDVTGATGADSAPFMPPNSEPVRSIDVTDGGVFDNLGVEPVWADHALVLVSDASPSFGPSPDLGPVWPTVRPIVTLLEQATLVRKRWLISNFSRGFLEGAYWGVASLPSHYGHVPDAQPYSDELVDRYLSQVRIELDAFSPAEIGILENHGYLMCDLAVRRHLPGLPAIDAPVMPPHPELMDGAIVERELRSSHTYQVLGRGWR